MSDPFEDLAATIKPKTTDIWGLKFFPDLEPDTPNTQDHPNCGWISRQEVTDCNIEVVRNIVKDLGDRLKTVVEIGVNRNGERSMSRILMDERPKGSYYLGIDIEDKSYLDDPESNTWTIKCNSMEQDLIRNFMSGIGIKEIDLLFIDGDHSVNACVNDWRYSDMLSAHGIVILHDTNSHPGCVALFQAVDENLFDKERSCLEDDFGIAVFRRKS